MNRLLVVIPTYTFRNYEDYNFESIKYESDYIIATYFNKDKTVSRHGLKILHNASIVFDLINKDFIKSRYGDFINGEQIFNIPPRLQRLFRILMSSDKSYEELKDEYSSLEIIEMYFLTGRYIESPLMDLVKFQYNWELSKDKLYNISELYPEKMI
jgi:hypothetical protein